MLAMCFVSVLSTDTTTGNMTATTTSDIKNYCGLGFVYTR
jgi:hypothetical protein